MYRVKDLDYSIVKATPNSLKDWQYTDEIDTSKPTIICLGGNMTMIGAAANVIVTENAHKAGHKISFMYFLKYGIIVTMISLAISTVYVYLRYLK